MSIHEGAPKVFVPNIKWCLYVRDQLIFAILRYGSEKWTVVCMNNIAQNVGNELLIP